MDFSGKGYLFFHWEGCRKEEDKTKNICVFVTNYWRKRTEYIFMGNIVS